MWRAGDLWDNTATWNAYGDFPAILSSEKSAAVSGASVTIDVTDDVQWWSDTTHYNAGWVIKGSVTDSTDTEFYTNSSPSFKPRLQVSFIPPDTTAPTVTGVVVGSSISPHPDYTIPVGSGEQLRTVPVAKPNQIFITFSEGVTNVSTSTILLATKSGTSIPGTVTYSAGVATVQLSSSITSPTKVVLTVKSGASGIKDAANNQLDGEWSNPASLATSSSKNFPSGNSVAGGDFVFNFTVLPGDYDRTNIADAGDDVIWSKNRGIASGALVTQGDGDGDGDVDSDDHSVWSSNFGVDQTVW